MKCHWLFTVRSRSLQLWCVVYYRLAGKPQASCDRMLGSQQQGIKCRRFYYNMRSTIQLTLRPQALLHLRLAMAPRLTSGSTGQLWRARNHSLKSVDADGLMDLKSTALISKSNVSWFEISLLDNWYNKYWKHLYISSVFVSKLVHFERMAMSFKASNFYSINYKMLPVKSGFYWFKIFSNFPLYGNGCELFLWIWIWQAINLLNEIQQD